MGFLGWIIPGLIAGLIARVIVRPGKSLGCLGTILLGMIGSVVGGMIASLMAGDGFALERSGWIGSIVGAIVILVSLRFFGSKTERP